jgi:hypothetical protein
MPEEYPLRLDIDRQDEYARLLPLVKWLLAIPHYIVLLVLTIGALFAAIAAFFAVLFTARYPEGLFNYAVGVMRWSQRVGAYVLLMTDRYPPFTLQHDPEHPVRFEIDHPEDGMARWRPLLQWLLAIPYLLVARILGYLAGLLTVFAFFTILFTKNYPDGMFRIVLVTMRWQARGQAYFGFLIPKYPPFVWG